MAGGWAGGLADGRMDGRIDASVGFVGQRGRESAAVAYDDGMLFAYGCTDIYECMAYGG